MPQKTVENRKGRALARETRVSHQQVQRWFRVLLSPCLLTILQYLYSSDSDDPGVRQVRVCDKGSKAHCVKVSMQ